MTADTTTLIKRCIERLHSGDPSARDELLSCGCDRLSRLAAKMLRSFPGVQRFEEAEDVLQNASLRLCRALEQVVPPSPTDFFRLAASIIRRELIDLARHYFGPQGVGVHVAAAAPGGVDAVLPEPSDSTNEPRKLAAWTNFHEYVETLAEGDRALFDLLWYQGLRLNEAAELLGVSERTVRRRWQAARLAAYTELHGVLPDA